MSGNAVEKQCRHDEFMARFGGLYEHSPWIAEKVFDLSDGEIRQTGEAGLEVLDRYFHSVVSDANRERQLELLNAHPELACTAVAQVNLTADSKTEQSAAGLDQCTQEEFVEFGQLNCRYRNKFGFPFILAVRGLNRQEILKIFRQRLDQDPEIEFAEAVRQVCRIGRFRLETHFHE